MGCPLKYQKLSNPLAFGEYNRCNMREIDAQEYKKLFYVDKMFAENKVEKALERAWKNRDFEIELYWKRATYFWAFITATFAGYIALQNIDITEENRMEILFLNFVMICLGVCFSLSWFLVNKESKKWQENWEAHIDMLEDKITGPIYKVVREDESSNFSVSKINLWVSAAVFCAWMFLLAYFLITHCNYWCFCSEENSWFAIFVRSMLVGLLIFLVTLIHNANANMKDQEYHFKLREPRMRDKKKS